MAREEMEWTPRKYQRSRRCRNRKQYYGRGDLLRHRWRTWRAVTKGRTRWRFFMFRCKRHRRNLIPDRNTHRNRWRHHNRRRKYRAHILVGARRSLYRNRALNSNRNLLGDKLRLHLQRARQHSHISDWCVFVQRRGLHKPARGYKYRELGGNFHCANNRADLRQQRKLARGRSPHLCVGLSQ